MSLDCFVPLTSFEALQEYALRHADRHRLKVSGSTRTHFVLEPRRQHFFWKHQLKLHVTLRGTGYELEMRTRGRKFRDVTRVPSVFDDFFAAYAEAANAPYRPVNIPQVALPY